MAKVKRPRSESQKPTAVEKDKRVNQVLKLLLNGLSRAEICQFVSEKTDWNVDERTIDRYIAEANAIFKEKSNIIREQEIGKSLLRLENLYARNMQITDFKAALAVQKEINAMLGLNAPKSIELTTWETKALEYIRDGRVKYAAMVAEYGEDLAADLFRKAGVVPVEME